MHTLFDQQTLLTSLWITLGSAAVFSFLIWLILKRFSFKQQNAKSVDSSSRWADQKPMLGGIILFAAFLFDHFLFRQHQYIDYEEFSRFLSLAVAFCMGSWDDRKRLSAVSKLTGQLI